MPSQTPRPPGVVALVVLQIIGGVISFLGGMVFMAPRRSVDSFDSFLVSLGPLFILSGLFKFLLAWGLWAGRSWARTTAMVFAAFSLLGIPVGTIIGALLLYYLTRPPVEAFFGRAAPVSTPVAAPPPAGHTPSPTSTPAFVLCPSCRATIPGDAVFCGKCGADLRPRAPAAPPPAPAGPRYCVSCGATVGPNIRFCPACGGRVG